MRVLLHTPLKPPDSATPSGDREMARGLVRLLRRLGHNDEAADAYRSALALAGTGAEQRYLARRLSEVVSKGDTKPGPALG